MHITTHNSKLVKDVALLDRCLEVKTVGPPSRPPRPAPTHLRGRLSEADQDAIVTAYTTHGATMKGLATQYGVSDYSVRMILARAGVYAGAQVLSESQREQIRAMSAAGQSDLAIARQTGVPHSTVALVRAARRYGTSH